MNADRREKELAVTDHGAPHLQTGGVALITGAAGGLGSAIADTLAERGWSLVLSGLPSDPLDALAADLASRHGVDTLVLTADLTDAAQISQLVRAADAWKLGIDCLINNAGRPSRATIDDITVEEWDAAFAVNLRAPMLLTQAFASCFRVTQSTGSIVNMASRTYTTAGPPAYVSSKAGIIGLTRSSAFALGPRGIRVNAVAPSLVATPFVSGSRTPEQMGDYVARQSALSALKRSPVPSEIATAVAFLAGGDSSYITGEVLHVAGGLQLPPIP